MSLLLFVLFWECVCCLKPHSICMTSACKYSCLGRINQWFILWASSHAVWGRWKQSDKLTKPSCGKGKYHIDSPSSISWVCVRTIWPAMIWYDKYFHDIVLKGNPSIRTLFFGNINRCMFICCKHYVEVLREVRRWPIDFRSLNRQVWRGIQNRHPESLCYDLILFVAKPNHVCSSKPCVWGVRSEIIHQYPGQYTNNTSP